MSRMKQVMIASACLVLAALAVPVGVLAYTFAGNPPIPDGKVFAEGVTVVKDGYVSLFIAPLADGRVALIDSGNDKTGAAIDAALKTKGISREAVSAIFITHGHPDHTAACNGFPSATIYALDTELPMMRGEVVPDSPIGKVFGKMVAPCTNITPVHDGDLVVVGGTNVRVYAVPGHTSGSAVYLLDGALFFGDAADATKDGGIAPSKWLFSENMDVDTKALVALADRLTADQTPVSALAFSHTGVLEGLTPLQNFAKAHH